jgi:AcrR family transcriptional regulator
MQRQARAEQSRRQVLDAALQLFSTQGYRGTNVREIADKAKVSTGNVYHHFEDKEAIFRALLDE